MFKKRLFLLVGLIAIFMISFSVSYLSYGYFFEPERKPTTVAILNNTTDLKDNLINQNTLITKLEKYKCGNEISENINNIQWIGKTASSLKDIYQPGDGWMIKVKDNKILISKYYDKKCPYHKMKHFGIYNNKLAIFEGPLGDNVKVLEIESNVNLNNLPLDYREKLKQAMKITDIHQIVNSNLRQELEFANDSELDEALQNLDEYMD